MHSITCIGRDEISRLFVFDDPVEEYGADGRELAFRVRTPSPKDETSFQLTLLEKRDGEYKIISIEHNNGSEYAAKGIPDSLLPYLTQHLGKRICSSRVLNRIPASKQNPFGLEQTKEFRLPPATKMWNRLVSNGLAKYFPEEDIYRTISPKLDT